MKKILKIIIIVIVIAIILLLINYFRNFNILNKMIENGNTVLKEAESYHISVESSIDDNNYKEDLYCKNNIYLMKKYENEELKSIFWKNTKTNESVAYFFESGIISYVDENFSEDFENSYDNNLVISKDVNISNFSSICLFKIIKSSKDYYIIKNNGTEFYYLKENGLLKELKTENYSAKYLFEENTVEDSEVLKPEI